MNQFDTLLHPDFVVPIVPHRQVLSAHSVGIKGGTIASVMPRSEASERGITEAMVPPLMPTLCADSTCLCGTIGTTKSGCKRVSNWFIGAPFAVPSIPCQRLGSWVWGRSKTRLSRRYLVDFSITNLGSIRSKWQLESSNPNGRKSSRNGAGNSSGQHRR